jgi:hypothetical protein
VFGAFLSRSARKGIGFLTIPRATMNVVILMGTVVVTGSAHCILHGILRDTAITGSRRIVTSPCGRLQAKSINEYDLQIVPSSTQMSEISCLGFITFQVPRSHL